MTTLEMVTLQPPHRILQHIHSAWAVETLRSGVRLDVFGKLASKPSTALQLAEQIGTEANATELLLNALVALEYLEKKNDTYVVTETSRQYLCPDSKLFMGSYVSDARLANAWSNLTDVVKTGQPIHKVNTENKAEEFFPALAASIFPMNYGTAHALATELKVEQLPAGTKILDVAAGSGVWSLPFAERNKNVHVDALDFPGVLEVTKRFAEENGVGARYSYIAGNWSECKLAENHYDFVMLGHILHSEGMERSIEMLKQAHRCLKKGGRIVIAEMISDNARSKAVFPQLFALNMLLMTEDGCVFTEAELHDLLAKQGFSDIKRVKLPFWGDESPVMIATK